MSSSFEVGGNGGRSPAETRAGAPDKARFPSDPVFDSSEEVAEDLGGAARSATDALKRQAAQFADDVGQELNRTGETQKARGVDALQRVARAIDDAANDLQDQSPIVARTVREAARQVDGLSDALASRNLSDLVDQTVGFARRQPMLFVGGSVAVGFVLARFLMTSAGHRRRAASRSSEQDAARYTAPSGTGYGDQPTTVYSGK